MKLSLPLSALPIAGFVFVLATPAFAQYQSDFAIADFNGDGKPDLVGPDGNTGAFYLYLGNGDGTLQNFKVIPVTDASEASCLSVVTADFNGDGKPDVAVGCGTGTGVVLAVMNGNGDGTFQPAAIYPISRSLLPISVGDLNGDGKPDIVVGGGNRGCIRGCLCNFAKQRRRHLHVI